MRGVLVQAGRQADAIGKFDPHHVMGATDRRGANACARPNAAARSRLANVELVRGLGVEREQHMAGKRIEFVHEVRAKEAMRLADAAREEFAAAR